MNTYRAANSKPPAMLFMIVRTRGLLFTVKKLLMSFSLAKNFEKLQNNKERLQRFVL